jgi:undecaprenyl-diphosphatase
MALRPCATASPRRRGRARLSVRQAVVLGLIQGLAEVLPVSSSGHLVLVPALLGWPYGRLPADVRKTFEVALHTGAGVALGWLLREDAKAAMRDPLGTTLLTAPAAGIALALEDTIEARASTPQIAAVAQVVAAAAMAAARPGMREEANARDRLLIGAAQASALVPGVSRNGATLTAARALGFDREAAARLSWQAGLPIIGGATLLKLVRLAQRGLDAELRAPFAAGAAAAFASTLAAAPLLHVRRQRAIAAYRVALGTLALRRLHRLEWPRG